MRAPKRRKRDNSDKECMTPKAERGLGDDRGEDRGCTVRVISRAPETGPTVAVDPKPQLGLEEPDPCKGVGRYDGMSTGQKPEDGLRMPERIIEDGSRGEKVADRLCQVTSLKTLGLGLAWILFEGIRSGLCKAWLWKNLGRFLKNSGCEQLGKRHRSLFPFPFVWSRLEVKLRGSLFDDIFFETFWEPADYVDSWVLLSVKFCQHLHGGDLGFRKGNLQKAQVECLRCISRQVEVMLRDDHGHPTWGVAEIKEELASKEIGYAGEEIGKLEKLSVEQIAPSLPSAERGASIRLEDWLTDSTRELLRHPERLKLQDHGQDLPNLKGRVHIKEGERFEVAKLLVARRVCVWRRSTDTLTFRGMPVRNGLFGVAKPGKTVNGKPILRVIMNLVPTNSLFRVIEGSVHRLPSITQWGTIFVGEGEKIETSQADISSAFYLFRLPPIWQCILPFNIETNGKQLGPDFLPDEKYVLCANVLPMGWHSAVGLMEEAAERLLLDWFILLQYSQPSE